ncbi:MAG: ATP-binding protein, partial [Gemmatimonadaceae bacterium]
TRLHRMETVTRQHDSSGLTRVVVTGSESTGKTVLAQQLADIYRATLVPEFARDFAAQKEAALVLADADAIARGQMDMEDHQAAAAQGLIVQDTDLLSTVVYSRHYYGECADWIVRAAADRRPDLYLLLEIDVPWVEDGVRDRQGQREEVQQCFRDAVRQSGAQSQVITGSWDERMRRAREAIDRLPGMARAGSASLPSTDR